LSNSTLFACAPWYSEDAAERIIAAPFLMQINRAENVRGVRFSYNLLTSAFRDHRQINIMPAAAELSPNGALVGLPFAGPNGDPLAQLKATAAAVVAGISPANTADRAKALESHLRDSGDYQYTMQSPVRTPGMDPVEDFVANNPRGHCEYFAGALALMLRSVGIPSRVVVGYRGGDWNVVGSFYQVRQLNAHSWVEAYLPPRPENFSLFDKIVIPELVERARVNGAWMRLDPTTSNAMLVDTAAGSRWGEIQQVVDYLKFVWNNYVVGMDAVKQHESVYQPLAQGSRNLIRKLTTRETWSAWGRAVLESADPRKWTGETLGRALRAMPWFVGGGLAGWLLVRSVRMRRRGMVAASATAKRSCRAAPPVDFYVRLEELLARYRLRRTPEQTQREFVQTACGELAESPATRGVSALPRRVVEAFYRVRFGGRPLDDDERRQVELALSALAAAPVPGASDGDSADGRS
jgi:transglutaminase-like putative cysteine protease